MLSSLIVVVAVALALASFSKMALAQCPCTPYNGDTTIMVCGDPSLASIPDCVPNDITMLVIRTPSIPLVPETISRFTNMISLEIAYFDNPQVSKNFLAGQENITIFEIYETSLDSVDSDWFLYAPRIMGLYFANNKIASLASQTFSSLPLLEIVSLNRNQLTTLPPTLFQGTALKKLYLRENPWHCDCGLATFMQWTRDNGVSVGPGALCVEPEQVVGLDLNDLTPDLACKK